MTFLGRDERGILRDYTVGEGGGLPEQWTVTGDGQVSATADDTDEAVLTVVAPAGSEASGDLVFEVRGETGQTLLSLDPYGNVRMLGAVVDPTNGGAGLDIMASGGANRVFTAIANDGSGGNGVMKLAFFGSTAAAQPSAIANATDAASTMARLNDLLAAMRTLGLIDT